jgi:hypothetical protein
MDVLSKSVEFYQGLQQTISGNPQFAPLHELMPTNPGLFKDYAFSRNFHAMLLRKTLGNPEIRLMMVRAINEYQKKELQLPSFSLPSNPRVGEAIKTMDEKGFSQIPPIPPEKIEAMRSYFENFKVFGNDRKFRSIQEASKTENISGYPVSTILRCPHLMEMANDPEILSIVEGYLGATPTVVVMAAWWSFAGRDKPKDAQLFHYDYDDYRFCKLFIYLTDVDMESGPHCYVERTHRFEEIMRARNAWLSEAARFDDFYQRELRKSDEEVRKFFGREFSYLTGPAGSRFLVDTLGIHKGELPLKRDRLLAQITFGVTPSLQDAPNQIRLGTPEAAAIPEIVKKAPFSYVHRFFIDTEEPKAEVTVSGTRSSLENATLIFEKFDGWDERTLRFFLESIFKDANFRESLSEKIRSQNIKIQSFQDLMFCLRTLFRDGIEWLKTDPHFELVKQLGTLAQYEIDTARSRDAFDVKTKPNPTAVWWPNPSVDPKSSLFETLPIAKRYPIVTKETPMGSAGSCFAFEISYYLQAHGFNYVVTEQAHRPADGVAIDSPEEAGPYQQFSSSWGILFNTPSFRQIAEVAFGKRRLPKILARRFAKGSPDKPFYIDPFREGVFFLSPEAYEKDYDLHIEASRQALMKAKVFVLTLGLNECWEFIKDGSVVSRNPHTDVFYRLLRHKTLTVEENIANIQGFIDIVREHNPDFQVILSVSPIPFLATGRAEECHVVTANGHSKAVLRVAAEEIVRKNKGVYYFPSYEMVTTCIQSPWDIDQRHVTKQAVARVMDLFNAMFVWNG